MRLFIAIEIPEKIKDYLFKVQKIANLAKIKRVDKAQSHLTLKFLGEVLPNKLGFIKEKLKEVKFEPFSVQLASVGVFPSENYIRVIWAGVKPEYKIINLQRSIDEKLKNLFKKEKNFKPHITLGRVKFVDNKKEFVDKLKKIKVENKKIDINNFKLIKSTLTQKGPVYGEVGVFE